MYIYRCTYYASVSVVKARDERKTAKTRTREQRQETTGVHRDGEEMDMEKRWRWR